MPAPFQRLTVPEFALLLNRFPWQRRVLAVHMHHTWRPNRAQFRGHDSISGMWRFHVRERGFSDIAQHLTIAPDGGLWTGRNWNQPPASAAGHNGTVHGGPFMFETVGDFDRGCDVLDGAQLAAVLDVIRLVQMKFGLPPEALLFHNHMAQKSCPGTAIEFDAFVAQVRAHEPRLAAARVAGREGPFPDAAQPSLQLIDQAIRLLTQPTGARDLDPPDAELDYGDEDRNAIIAGTRDVASQARGLSPGQLEMLRPHIVNLRMGKFSMDGLATSTPQDVDEIFEQHLPRFLEAGGGKAALLFYAHGGLVAESKGLEVAQKHVGFWKRNGIYPISFIWETGLFETIGQLLTRSRDKAAAGKRDIADWLTDPALEELVRALQGSRIWGGMKASARAASEADGGARHVVNALAAFLGRHGERVSLHAVGHSAGSIFLAHFLEACQAVAPARARFKTLQLLAPAIDVETFKSTVLPLTADGGGIEGTTIFTMRRGYEKDDHCARIYRKSLLYLVAEACEQRRKTPILGLDTSLHEDPALKQLFGLGPTASPHGEVVWSVSDADSGRSASKSTSHGGFDDDAATMNSVLRRIKGFADADTIDVPYSSGDTREARDWLQEVDWPEFIETPERPAVPAPAVPATSVVAAAAASTTTTTSPASPATGTPARGRRRAVTVGINSYPSAPLNGCVADADLWRRTLQGLGFESLGDLRDAAATRDAILKSLEKLIDGSREGDTLVFQYAGHGTKVPDVSGDEQSGDSPDTDEALVPVDYADGAFVLDDDIARVIDRLPPGVTLSFLLDCCHSGSGTRFAARNFSMSDAPPEAVPRFITLSEDLKDKHRDYQRKLGLADRGRAFTFAPRAGGAMREVTFSACLSTELAYEVAGQGEFTRRAHDVIASHKSKSLTNVAFIEAVIQAFGSRARQTPNLDCDASMRPQRWLGLDTL
jgi:hypothetical protein